MFDPGTSLAADRPAVIDETFDGEAVLVHLGTGRYYALNEAATIVWELVRDGRSPAQVTEALGAALGEAAGEFLGKLVDEGLLVSTNSDGNGAAPVPVAPELNGRGWEDPPALQRFDDLEDLLLVDPIHDVTLGADGWPVPPKQ